MMRMLEYYERNSLSCVTEFRIVSINKTHSVV